LALAFGFGFSFSFSFLGGGQAAGRGLAFSKLLNYFIFFKHLTHWHHRSSSILFYGALGGEGGSAGAWGGWLGGVGDFFFSV